MIASSASRSAATRSSPIRSAHSRSMSAIRLEADGLGLAAALGQADDLGAAVGRVRDALDVAALLEVGGDLAHRLLGHAGALGQVGQP